ncbi:MAG: DNA polymerase III subunit beta [Defluviitaleaceae bacterium]|nr:DNA polymerase III subunit beta [Defluviitaleaceae bacterium]
MKLICPKAVLAENIALVSRAVATRATMPVLECVLLIADEAGFRLLSNNLEMTIETKEIDAEVFEMGGIALDGKVFFDIIRRLPGDDVEISVDAKNMTIIRSGRSEYKILGQSRAEFPAPPDVEKTQPYPVSMGIFRDMIRQCIFSISMDESKPVFTGGLLEIDENQMRMVTTDTYRVSLRQFDLPATNEHPISAIIPGKTLNEISRILPDTEDACDIYFSDNQVLFDLENCILTSRIIEGEFFKYSNVLTKDFVTKIMVNRSEFLGSVERVNIISRDAKKSPILLKSEDGKLAITSNSELGLSYDEVKITQDGQDFELKFNPAFISDILKTLDTDEIELYVVSTSAVSPCIIKIPETEDYTYLILPTRR